MAASALVAKVKKHAMFCGNEGMHAWMRVLHDLRTHEMHADVLFPARSTHIQHAGGTRVTPVQLMNFPAF